MKSLHRPDLFAWTVFNPERNLDFHGYLWTRGGTGNVAFDPLPLTEHDAAHIEREGGIAWIYLTNADHVRATAAVAARFGARIVAPVGERHLPELRDLPVARWLEPDEEDPVTGLLCLAMNGSKSPGELAFVLPGRDTAICGDLVRGPRGGSLDLLPAGKLSDRAAAITSVRRLLAVPGLDAVLPGDGHPVFRDAQVVLAELLAVLTR